MAEYSKTLDFELEISQVQILYVTLARFISTIDLVLYRLSPLFCLLKSSHRPVAHEDGQNTGNKTGALASRDRLSLTASYTTKGSSFMWLSGKAVETSVNGRQDLERGCGGVVGSQALATRNVQTCATTVTVASRAVAGGVGMHVCSQDMNGPHRAGYVSSYWVIAQLLTEPRRHPHKHLYFNGQ
ncbi:hypothetical protein J6590_059192 [Homalodisca vitripennis]|nr:hypothetical protein J6590_059192 [Homalodisca vitripennis]